jgi:hypothetical protein
MGATRPVTDAEVDAAAALLYEHDIYRRAMVAWSTLSVDEKAPYRRMARMMLEAAASVADDAAER